MSRNLLPIACISLSIFSGYGYFLEHNRAESLLAERNLLKPAHPLDSERSGASTPRVSEQSEGILLQSSSKNSLILNTADASSFEETMQLPESDFDRAYARRNANEMLATFEKIFPFDEELHQKLYQYYYEIYLGIRPEWNPRPDADGNIQDELMTIMGAERWDLYQKWQQSSSERLMQIENEKQVSYLSGILGLDPSQEENLRTSLNDPDRYIHQEVSLFSKTLGLNPSQEETVRTFWAEIDGEVAAEKDKLLNLEALPPDQQELLRALPLSDVDQRKIKREVLSRRLQGIVTEEQLSKLSSWEELIDIK